MSPSLVFTLATGGTVLSYWCLFDSDSLGEIVAVLLAVATTVASVWGLVAPGDGAIALRLVYIATFALNPVGLGLLIGLYWAIKDRAVMDLSWPLRRL